MPSALECYNKWIAEPKSYFETLRPTARVNRLLADGKLIDKRYPKMGDRGAEIQKILANCSTAEQYERDVAMWYGYCKEGSKGAALMLRIFAILKCFGVMYRSNSNVWEDAADLGVPVASLLSHGGRILILLPPSHSGARAVASTVGTLLHGVTVAPLTALVNRGTYHTVRGKSTGGAVVMHGLARATGLSSLAAVLSTGHRAHAAGDDRLWRWLTHGDMHDRAFATHSTIDQGIEDAPALRKGRSLWFSEEKASGGGHTLSNIRDAMMGRHHYKNVALGGVGNVNPFSGMVIDKDGAHGHLYVNYRAPQYKRFGCLLVGVEGSAPGMGNQYGKVHDAKATKGEWSATGGKKWESLLPGTFYPSGDLSKDDVTTWVCDASDVNTTAFKGRVESSKFSQDSLDALPNRVQEFDWTELLKRA